MDFRRYNQNDTAAIVSLFTSVFTKSAGESEGQVIGQLAKNLLAQTAIADLACFVAIEDSLIAGAIIFSRVTFEQSIEAFILGPVAVQSDRQGQGIGQALINYGLNELKQQGVNCALTYGDPSFYQKVGFHAISPEQIRAPFTLSQPEGWLGQSLTDNAISVLAGPCTCVEALNHPQYW